MTLGKLCVVTIFAAGFSYLAVKSGSSHGRDDSPDLSSLSDADLKAITIQMERIGCFGSCPAYTLAIHGDGRVEYDGKAHVKEIGPREDRMEMEKIKGVALELGKTKFWRIADDYSEEKCKGRYCTDMATAVIEVRIDQKSHRVNHYYGCASAPRPLFGVEAAIDKAANVAQWTGDVSKSGPLGTTCGQK